MASQLCNNKADYPDLQQQKITIQNDHGENLIGLLHETGSKDLVVLCHGFRSSKEFDSLVILASALAKEGISTFRFDFSGNGESEGSFQYGNYRKEVEDLRSVLLHFRGAKRLISAIIGHSKGGNVVLLYAAKYQDVDTIVNVSGRFHLERNIEVRLGKDFMQRIKRDGFIDVKDKKTGTFIFRATKESLMDRLTTDMRLACVSIKQDCRVLTIHGSEDRIVSAKEAYEFGKRIVNHKLHIMDGADHDYTSHQSQLASTVLDFLKECFQQDQENTANQVISREREAVDIKSRL